MTAIRVLVVDDSVVIRRIITDLLSAEEDIEVAGTASNGKIALAKLDQLTPDLVTLDIEMPEMNGLEALPEIRKDRPRLPVIMFSTLTERGAEATIDALALGATDYVTKPANVGSAGAAMEKIRSELIPKIRALCPREAVRAKPAAVPSVSAPKKATTKRRVEVVTIGISTGGPNALAEMIPELPADLPVPIVLVQHMPPLFTGYLAKRLDANSKIQVREGEAGTQLEPGCCWIAPGGMHMAVGRQGTRFLLETNEAPPENHCRPAADVLFRSVAESYGSRVLGVVMTGMGQDGLLGCREIREKGGAILAQDEATSVVWGMPGYVAKEELADEVLPLNRLAAAIVDRVSFGRASTPNAD